MATLLLKNWKPCLSGLLVVLIWSRWLSTLTGIFLFGLYIWALTDLYPIEWSRQAYLIGGMWLIMTILFEFIFGHFIMGNPWLRLLHGHNLFQGRLWLLVLIWTTVAPYIFYCIWSCPKYKRHCKIQN